MERAFCLFVEHKSRKSRFSVRLLERWFPDYVTSTERIGRAMLALVRDGAPSRILECAEINRVAGGDKG